MNQNEESDDAPKIYLITGGLGYLGSQLIRDVESSAGEHTIIRILDNMQTGGYQALMQLPSTGRYQFIEGDILDPATVRLALQNVDTVIHLSAIVRTPMSFEKSAWVEQVNHWGTSHLLEACLAADVRRFIYASTTAVYGPGGVFTETDTCHPQGAYAQSKRNAENSVQATHERGLQTTILRFGTIYGYAPIVRFIAVANRLTYLAGVGRPLTIYGNGKQHRTLIHVRDASKAILFTLTHSNMIGRTFNVLDKNISILEIVETIRQLKPEIIVRYTEQDIRTHLSFEASNNTILRLGWQPQITIKDGLAELLGKFEQFETINRPSYNFE